MGLISFGVFMRWRLFCWIVVGLAAIHVAPIWGFNYFPSQDGPAHIASAYVLRHYLDPASHFSLYYSINLTPVPTWLPHATLALLMLVVDPLLAEKVLLTGYVVIFVLSMYYYLRSFGEDQVFFLTLAFPFLYNYFFHMGFYGFAFGIPLVFLILGYWWRHRGEGLRRDSLITLNLLLVLLYFCHIVCQVIAVAFILLLALLHYGRKIGRTVALSVSLGPSLVLPVYFILTRHAGRLSWAPFVDRLKWFLELDALYYFDARQRYLALAVTAAYGIALTGTLILRMRQLRTLNLKGCRSCDSLFILSLFATFLYFVVPRRIYGGGGLAYRLIPFPYLAILQWLNLKPWKSLRIGVGTIAICVTVLQVGISTHYYHILNKGLHEYTSAIPLVEKNKTYLGISFDHKGESDRVQSYRHASAYYSIATGAIDLGIYEADKGYFPLVYKAGLSPYQTIGKIESTSGSLDLSRYPQSIDYLVVWKPKEFFPALPWIEANYILQYSSDGLKLYEYSGSTRGSGHRSSDPGPK